MGTSKCLVKDVGLKEGLLVELLGLRRVSPKSGNKERQAGGRLKEGGDIYRDVL